MLRNVARLRSRPPCTATAAAMRLFLSSSASSGDGDGSNGGSDGSHATRLSKTPTNRPRLPHAPHRPPNIQPASAPAGKDPAETSRTISAPTAASDMPPTTPSTPRQPQNRPWEPVIEPYDSRRSTAHILAEALAEAAETTHSRPRFPRRLTPRQIRNLLDEHIVGQDRLKKAISVAIYNHYKRIEINHIEIDSVKDIGSSLDDSQFLGKPHRRYRQHHELEPLLVEKSNVLLIGPTGSGKTLIAKTTAKILDVPFSMNDATPFTQAGYVGEDVEACIYKLLQNANFDVDRAQRGIVFIDEIDKLAKRADASSPNQRDVSGEGVQQGLLRILEGTVVNVNVKAGVPIGNRTAAQGGEVFAVDTSNILFVCSGAFIDLDKIVQNRIGVKASIGFDAPLVGNKAEAFKDTHNVLHLAEPDDLIQFGFIPEFIGRLPVIASSDPLRIEELERILTEPKNAIIKQFQHIFRCSNMKLLFHPLALRKIAEIASVKKTGARGLRRIVESVLQDPLYEYPGTEYRYIVVTEETVAGTAGVLAFKVGDEDEAYQCAGLPIPLPVQEDFNVRSSHVFTAIDYDDIDSDIRDVPAAHQQQHRSRRPSITSYVSRRRSSTPSPGPEGFDSIA